MRPTVKRRLFISYCRFRDENGNYISPISILQFTKAAAQNWADQKLKEGKIILPSRRGIAFEVFAEGSGTLREIISSGGLPAGIISPVFQRTAGRPHSSPTDR